MNERKEKRMKHLPRVLFWAGIVSIPLSWLIWYFEPKIEIRRQVINNINDPTLRSVLMEAQAEDLHFLVKG
tara:strand:- start:82 stop:294 length:213 start_codon:yes stop_codon:yes gene_type:complete